MQEAVKRSRTSRRSQMLIRLPACERLLAMADSDLRPLSDPARVLQKVASSLRSSAVAVCGATRNSAASTFGVSMLGRDRRSQLPPALNAVLRVSVQ